MASTLYLGTDTEALAVRLAAALAAPGRDPFVPTTIVVPNRYLAKWLRLWLARRQGVAINLHIEPNLERLLWDLCRAVDGRTHGLHLQLASESDYGLMLVAALLDEAASPAEAPLRDYLHSGTVQPGRDYWRRLWQLAHRLAGLLRDYEYHRQDALILKWLKHKNRDAYPRAAPAEQAMERAQRALFNRVVAEPDGLRVRLGRHLKRLVKTLPQYVGEVRELPPELLRDVSGRPAVHLFGLTQISALHVHTLHWLGERQDVQLYHLNPLAGQLSTSRPPGSRELRQAAEECVGGPGRNLLPLGTRSHGLLHTWGRAAGEALTLMAELTEDQPFQVEVVPAPERKHCTVLGQVQRDVSARETASGHSPQDRSIQVVGCPGVFREVETVYQSIIHNLQSDPTLQQTDIAVLATDMALYRPVVQTVFDREPRHVAYNLADYSAAELSAFGHAVLGLLDLAQESFTRSRVFALLLNPCFLARQGVERDRAAVWLDWVEALHVHHGWDAQERRERGYPASPLYSWRLALQRLRLGRLMDAGAARFNDVIPYADLASGDREQLDAFGRSVEGLLPRLAALRSRRRSGADWARELRSLVDDFLAVPADRPNEEQVRVELAHALDHLPLLDALRGGAADMPLALVREFVQENLATLKATPGEFLTGGVTVSALQPLLPVPFRIIYVLGLGEAFPGSDTLSALDLRSRQRLPGDIRPAEANRYLFLQTLLAARDKAYLLYNCRDLQQDKVLPAASPVLQLQRYLEEHVVGQTWQKIDAPLRGSDPALLQPASDVADCLVTCAPTDRLLAVTEAAATGALSLDESQAEEVTRRLASARAEHHLLGEDKAGTVRPVSLGDLRRFLNCPAEAALRRHLRLVDDEEREPADDEPFASDRLASSSLATEALRQFLTHAIDESVEKALAEWRPRLAELYDDWRLRGRVPDGAFAQVDRARLEDELQERIEGSQGLAAFVVERRDARFVGPVLLGESPTPVGAQMRLAALPLTLVDGTVVPLVGVAPLVWQSPDTIDALVLTSRKESRVPEDHLSDAVLEPILFYLALCGGGDALLGRRTFRVYATHRDGMVGFTYEPGDFDAAAARQYLQELTSAYLDRASYDLLPFDLVAKNPLLQAAYELPEDGLARSRYSVTLQEIIDEDAENPFPTFRAMRLLEVMEAQVPEDAYDKIRRRFRPLDSGPARHRAAAGGANGDD